MAPPGLIWTTHVSEWAEPPSRPPQPVPLALISLHAARVLPAQLCFSEWGIQWGHLIEVVQSWKTRNSLILLFEELELGDSRVRDSSLMLSWSLSLELFGLVANISKYGLQDKYLKNKNIYSLCLSLRLFNNSKRRIIRVLFILATKDTGRMEKHCRCIF